MAATNEQAGAVARVITAAVVEVFRQGDPTAAVTTTLPSAIGHLVKGCWDAYSQRQARKVEAWFHDLAAVTQHGSVDALLAVLQEHIDKPWVHKAVVDSVRTILQDIDEAAIPFLAGITARVFVDRETTDRSRRAIGMLADARGVVLHQLRALILEIFERWPKDTPAGVIQIQDVGLLPMPGTFYQAVLVVYDKSKSDSGDEVARAPSKGDALLDVLAVLKRHGFGGDMPSGFWGIHSGGTTGTFRKDDVEYLATVFKGR